LKRVWREGLKARRTLQSKSQQLIATDANAEFEFAVLLVGYGGNASSCCGASLSCESWKPTANWYWISMQ
jgi:hypothetical protein